MSPEVLPPLVAPPEDEELLLPDDEDELLPDDEDELLPPLLPEELEPDEPDDEPDEPEPPEDVLPGWPELPPGLPLLPPPEEDEDEEDDEDELDEEDEDDDPEDVTAPVEELTLPEELDTLPEELDTPPVLLETPPVLLDTLPDELDTPPVELETAPVDDETLPEVLVLDAHLPGASGFEVLRMLRALPGLEGGVEVANRVPVGLEGGRVGEVYNVGGDAERQGHAHSQGEQLGQYPGLGKACQPLGKIVDRTGAVHACPSPDVTARQLGSRFSTKANTPSCATSCTMLQAMVWPASW